MCLRWTEDRTVCHCVCLQLPVLSNGLEHLKRIESDALPKTDGDFKAAFLYRSSAPKVSTDLVPKLHNMASSSPVGSGAGNGNGPAGGGMGSSASSLPGTMPAMLQASMPAAMRGVVPGMMPGFMPGMMASSIPMFAMMNPALAAGFAAQVGRRCRLTCVGFGFSDLHLAWW